MSASPSSSSRSCPVNPSAFSLENDDGNWLVNQLVRAGAHLPARMARAAATAPTGATDAASRAARRPLISSEGRLAPFCGNLLRHP
ncbi:hypothetical protein WME97_41750 [Sorangium sp. So ce367]|uniref:hypothetical protein n=1 Tax=Sorangium sp. So ce367 TaxID=3133305 RepID=UPI003F5E9163